MAKTQSIIEATRYGRGREFHEEIHAAMEGVCANCGSTKHIEYHHIVPLRLGGTNRLTNIVPLCHRCHAAAHNGRHVKHYADHPKDSGRPAKCDNEAAFEALDLLAAGEIGVRRCKALMNLSDRTQPQKVTQYSIWREKRGVTSLRNFLDVKITNSPMSVEDGCVIGEVSYADGRTESICFNDTGLNDSTVYRVRNQGYGFMTWGDIKKRQWMAV